MVSDASVGAPRSATAQTTATALCAGNAVVCADGEGALCLARGKADDAHAPKGKADDGRAPTPNGGGAERAEKGTKEKDAKEKVSYIPDIEPPDAVMRPQTALGPWTAAAAEQWLQLDRRSWLEVADPSGHHRYAKNLRRYHRDWDELGRPHCDFWAWLDGPRPAAAAGAAAVPPPQLLPADERRVCPSLDDHTPTAITTTSEVAKHATADAACCGRAHTVHDLNATAGFAVLCLCCACAVTVL